MVSWGIFLKFILNFNLNRLNWMLWSALEEKQSLDTATRLQVADSTNRSRFIKFLWTLLTVVLGAIIKVWIRHCQDIEMKYNERATQDLKKNLQDFHFNIMAIQEYGSWKRIIIFMSQVLCLHRRKLPESWN